MRIQQLEDALAILHHSISTERHPLLREELLQIKFAKKQIQPSVPPTEALSNSLGTMTVSPHGDAKYFGPSAGAEVCFTYLTTSFSIASI